MEQAQVLSDKLTECRSERNILSAHARRYEARIAALEAQIANHRAHIGELEQLVEVVTGGKDLPPPRVLREKKEVMVAQLETLDAITKTLDEIACVIRAWPDSLPTEPPPSIPEELYPPYFNGPGS